MRRGLLLLVFAAGCASSAPKAVPRVAARTFEGASVDVGAPTTKPTLIVFWATWCASCRLEMPKLVALASARHESLAILGINVDTDVDTARKFLTDAPLPYPNVSDPTLVVADAFGATQTPTLILVSEQGLELERGHDLEAVVAHLDAQP